MIKSFKHKGLENFYTTGSTKGIQAMHAHKISKILAIMTCLTTINDLNSPAYRLHPLRGDLKDYWSVTVQANWRIIFQYDDVSKDVYVVDYLDYH